MTGLLELREKLREFYGRYEIYAVAGAKFALGLVLFFTVNSRMGYMEQLDHPALALLLALACAFLPWDFVALAGGVLVLAHLFALSMEACFIGLCLFALLFLLYARFAPGNGCGMALTFLLWFCNAPQVMPVALGLLKGPSSYLSILCGTTAFFYVRDVQANVADAGAAGEGEMLTRLSAALGSVVGDKELYLSLAAFLATSLLVYFIRRRPVNYSWRIAIAVGSLADMAILLVGHILLGMQDSVGWIVAGTVAAAAVSLVLEFFLYNLDYSRVERVQFEDDEYYYFVKAVPKMFVAKKEKRVKKITPGRRAPSGPQEGTEEEKEE